MLLAFFTSSHSCFVARIVASGYMPLPITRCARSSCGSLPSHLLRLPTWSMWATPEEDEEAVLGGGVVWNEAEERAMRGGGGSSRAGSGQRPEKNAIYRGWNVRRNNSSVTGSYASEEGLSGATSRGVVSEAGTLNVQGDIARWG